METQTPNGARKRKRRIWIAIVMILVLATLAIPFLIRLYLYCGPSGSQSRSKAEIVALGYAIEAYKLDHGKYPPSGSINLYIALSGNRSGTGLNPDAGNNYFRSFRDGKGGNIRKQDGQYVIIDPYGNPYNYANGSDASHRKDAFDLWSNGPDGLSGTEDDIGSWELRIDGSAGVSSSR